MVIFPSSTPWARHSQGGAWAGGAGGGSPWGGHQVQKPWTKQAKGAPFGGGSQAPWNGKGSQAPWNGKGGGRGGNNFTNIISQLPWQAPSAWTRKPPRSIPRDFRVDHDARYQGTVGFYHKWKGYGFIDVSDTGIIPGDKLFVHWKQLQSDDRFPFLVKEMDVEFGAMTRRDNHHGYVTLQAKNVTMPGGMNLALQDDIDAQQKTFVGGQHLRYTGTLKFFSPKHAFGYVIMDQGYDVDPEVPNELRVEAEEVNAGGQQAQRMENVAVEFGIWKNRRGQFKVYNMTLPGGHPLTQDALENRITQGPTSFRGEVIIWNWRRGWGFLKPGPLEVMPARVLTKLAEQNEAAVARGKKVSQDVMLYFRKTDVSPGLNVRQGLEVSFQVYIDDKGAGASDVHA